MTKSAMLRGMLSKKSKSIVGIAPEKHQQPVDGSLS
jgi:hypothetical protein